MCGIAGGWTYRNINEEALRSSLFHRGPDSQNFFKKNEVFLYHTRLSILDTTSAASQPFHFENLVLVYNGEVYNFKEIRKVLEGKGYTFSTNSDTEVVIKAFHCWRELAVQKFIGMFAFAIYDTNSDNIYLFRDRVGVKPLYYSHSNSGFYFGSELKVFNHFPVAKTINLESVAEYFRFGFISGSSSIFNEVQKLLPGHYLCWSNSGVILKKYWSVREARENEAVEKTEKQWIDQLEETLISAFNYRMVSDVPVGVFLSGGIDSTLVTAILQKHNCNINTFTIGFKESQFNESGYAKKISNYLKTNHTEKILSIDVAKELLHQFYDIYDEPFADSSGIPTALVTALAKEHGIKVVLSADGGDELFGGYNHYFQHARLFKTMEKIPSNFRNLLAVSSKVCFPKNFRERFLPKNLEHRAYAFEEIIRSKSFIKFYENSIANQAETEIHALFKEGKISKSTISWHYGDLKSEDQMMLWDYLNYLPNDLLVKVDRATMFNSVEGRDPFLDHRLVEMANDMPLHLKIRNGKGKYILRKVLRRYVPDEFFERPKQGFSIPMFQWFSQEFDILFEKYLSYNMVTSTGFLNYSEIEKEKRKYRYNKAKGYQHNIEKMWRLLSFMMWWEKWGRNA
jgi:asparagine synthase (glutamine-hydrolysing)